MRRDNLKNKEAGGGLGGGVSCFYSFGEPLTHGLTQCLHV